MRVLMLGNSLTTANGLPERLAQRLGAEIVVHARGGARLAEHLNAATRLGGMTQRALMDEQWDFVVMQESSNGPVVHRTRFLEAAEHLCEQVKTTGATPALFATWAYEPALEPARAKLAKMGLTHAEMHDGLRDAYHTAAGNTGAIVADVGEAFFEAPSRAELYRSDGIHPSEAGTELAVDVIADCLAAAHEPEARPYIVYILRCEDGSYYTGITTDVERRFAEHLSGGPKAARYTRTHRPVSVEATWEAPDRASASVLEYHIKQMTHAQKASLIASALADPSGTIPNGS